MKVFNTFFSNYDDNKTTRSYKIIALFSILPPIGCLLIVFYVFSANSLFNAISGLGIMGAVAGASFVLGLLIGFLFGIPRIVETNDSSNTKSSSTKIRANTNLEQISDWLTKILVGVGLTQIIPILHFFKTKVVENLAPGFDFIDNKILNKPSPIAIGMTIGVITYFFVSGFILGYFWTVLIFSQSLKYNYEQLEEKVDNFAKINNRIQLVRQIIDAIPDENFVTLDFAYKEPISKIVKLLDVVTKSIDKILSRLKSIDNSDIPSNLDSFLDEITKNIDNDTYFFLRSVDYVKLGTLIFLKEIIKEKGDYSKVVTFLDKAIDINEYSYIAHNIKGLAYLRLKNFDLAIKSFKKAIKIDKTNSKAWNNKGAALVQEISSKIDRKNSKVWINKGRELEKKALEALEKKALEALESLKSSILIDPCVPTAYTNKGFALSLLKRLKTEIGRLKTEIGEELDVEKLDVEKLDGEELDAYNRALEIDNKFTVAFYNKACFYAQKNDIEKTIENLKEAIKLNPDIKKLAAAEEEEDFESVRENADFKELVK